MRNKYLSKLVYNNVWKIGKQEKNKTISIFDWDDTLFCTSTIVDLDSDINSKSKLPKDIRE